jgi:energy-converting hydrogenase B subunit D
MFETFNTVLLLLCACSVVWSRDLIRSLIWLSTFSLVLTLQYVVLRAPDVAITEAALGTGLSTIVFLTAIRKTTTHRRGLTIHQED